MVQDGDFRADLEVSGIAVMYQEFLDLAAQENEGFDPAEITFPTQRASTESPTVIGNGPIEFTTCTDLARVYPPYHVWDAEGYYRTLGVHHLADRRELRRAYLATHGQGSERLTFIIKTLLNSTLRLEYDMLPLGARFVEDPDVQDEIKRRAYIEAMRRNRLGHSTTGDAVLNEWGFKYVEDSIGQSGSNENGTDERLWEEARAGQDGVVNDAWCYSFYLWRSTTFDAPLKAWQEALVRAASRAGLTTKMAVGVIGGSEEPFVIGNFHQRTVVLLGDGIEPSDSLADQAITYLSPHTPR